MNASRQAPTLPPRPVGSPCPSSTLMSSSATIAARAAGDLDGDRDGVTLRQLGGLEADDDQRLRAVEPGRPLGLDRVEDPQLAGHSLACTIWRTASVPASHVGNTMPAVARNVGRRWIAHPRLGDHAEDPLAADRPSGPGSALRPNPGSRRLSHHPFGVSIRTDSTKSSMWVWLVA